MGEARGISVSELVLEAQDVSNGVPWIPKDSGIGLGAICRRQEPLGRLGNAVRS